MEKSFTTYADARLKEIIRTELEESGGNRNVFVLLGLSDIVDTSCYQDNIVDPVTFPLDGNGSVFDDEEWFDRIRAELRKDRAFHLMSYQQYTYYTSYANLARFKERAVIIHDNVRSLFPLKNDAYVEKAGEENLEERQESMPLYHSEQLSIEGETFCSYVTHAECRMIPFFEKTIPVEFSSGQCTDILELDEHLYTLDVLLNRALHGESGEIVLGAKLAKGIVREEEIMRRLALANGFLDLLGAGKVVLIGERSVQEDYVPREETVRLLKRYWGEGAEFRKMRVYKNPGESNALVDVSQGQVVDTIIDEYEKARGGEAVPDDVFITAPTGSGKSLLFQLPAFHVSDSSFCLFCLL